MSTPTALRRKPPCTTSLAADLEARPFENCRFFYRCERGVPWSAHADAERTIHRNHTIRRGPRGARSSRAGARPRARQRLRRARGRSDHRAFARGPRLRSRRGQKLVSREQGFPTRRAAGLRLGWSDFGRGLSLGPTRDGGKAMSNSTVMWTVIVLVAIAAVIAAVVASRRRARMRS